MSIQLQPCHPNAILTCGVSYYFENLSGDSVPIIQKVAQECIQNFIGSARGTSTYTRDFTAAGNNELISCLGYSMVISCKKALSPIEDLLNKVKEQMKTARQGISLSQKDQSEIGDARVQPIVEGKENEKVAQKKPQKFDLPHSKIALEDFWGLNDSVMGIKEISFDESKLRITFIAKSGNADRAHKIVELIHKYFPTAEIREKTVNEEFWTFSDTQSSYREKTRQILVDIDCIFQQNVEPLHRLIFSASDLSRCSGNAFSFALFLGNRKASYKSITFPKIKVQQDVSRLFLNSDEESNSDSD